MPARDELDCPALAELGRLPDKLPDEDPTALKLALRFLFLEDIAALQVARISDQANCSQRHKKIQEQRH